MISLTMATIYQSPTLGAHTHAHVHPCPWVLGGHGCDVIVHEWAWVGMGAILLFMGGHGCDIIFLGWAGGGIGFVHPCIQLQIGVKLLGCKEYANQ
jgi:hypothetical protein